MKASEYLKQLRTEHILDLADSYGLKKNDDETWYVFDNVAELDEILDKFEEDSNYCEEELEEDMSYEEEQELMEELKADIKHEYERLMVIRQEFISKLMNAMEKQFQEDSKTHDYSIPKEWDERFKKAMGLDVEE